MLSTILRAQLVKPTTRLVRQRSTLRRTGQRLTRFFLIYTSEEKLSATVTSWYLVFVFITNG